MEDIVVDGVAWTPTSDRPCARCAARTYKMSRRTARELIVEILPGLQGANTFTALGSRRLFTLCTKCFVRRFASDRKRVLEWERGARSEHWA